MAYQRHRIAVTTDGSGAATVYSDTNLTGKVLALHYVKGNFDNGVDFAITIEGTGEGLWTQSDVNASASVYPRAPTHSQIGVAATLDGTRPALDKIALVNDRMKVIIAQGGAAKTGAFIVVLE